MAVSFVQVPLGFAGLVHEVRRAMVRKVARCHNTAAKRRADLGLFADGEDQLRPLVLANFYRGSTYLGVTTARPLSLAAGIAGTSLPASPLHLGYGRLPLVSSVIPLVFVEAITALLVGCERSESGVPSSGSAWPRASTVVAEFGILGLPQYALLRAAPRLQQRGLVNASTLCKVLAGTWGILMELPRLSVAVGLLCASVWLGTANAVVGTLMECVWSLVTGEALAAHAAPLALDPWEREKMAVAPTSSHERSRASVTYSATGHLEAGAGEKGGRSLRHSAQQASFDGHASCVKVPSQLNPPGPVAASRMPLRPLAGEIPAEAKAKKVCLPLARTLSSTAVRSLATLDDVDDLVAQLESYAALPGNALQLEDQHARLARVLARMQGVRGKKAPACPQEVYNVLGDGSFDVLHQRRQRSLRLLHPDRLAHRGLSAPALQLARQAHDLVQLAYDVAKAAFPAAVRG